MGDEIRIREPRRRRDATESAGRAARVEEWRRVYERLYKVMSPDEFMESFPGWRSSLTGEPMAHTEMEAWRAEVCDRIRSLAPRRVLELGVGNGLVLAAIAPECDEYWGTDLSSAAVDRLHDRISRSPGLMDRVRLAARPAHDLSDLPRGRFDTVVINSVVQYFPGHGYLTEVLDGARDLLADGGAIFVGDVRDVRLLRHQYACMVAGAAPGGDRAVLREAIAARSARDEELSVHPDFFSSLADPERWAGDVEFHLKRSRFWNEMTKYRYDVVLRPFAPRRIGAADHRTLRWGTDLADLNGLDRVLTAERPRSVTVSGVPNRRISADQAVLDWLDGLEPAIATAMNGQEPDDFYRIGEVNAYDVNAVTSLSSGLETFDVMYRSHSA